MCGRFRWDYERALDMTAGEFEDMVQGGIEGERVLREGFALVYSGIAGFFAGVRVSVAHVLGEDGDLETVGDVDNPIAPPSDSPETKFARFEKAREAAARKALMEYLPPGMREEMSDVLGLSKDDPER